MRILIIGGTGYIGSRLFQSLSASHSVDTVDLEWHGNYTNPKNRKLDSKDLTVQDYDQYEAVLMFSGFPSVPSCQGKMVQSFDMNVVRFVDTLSKIRAQKFIYASSSSVYGNTACKEADETWDRFQPSDYYDLTKKVIDLYAELSDVRFYGLRMGTVAGPSPNLRVDTMINKMYHSAKTTGKISIYNPHIYRPILGVNDLCRAVSKLVDQDCEHGFYNLASFNASVSEISNTVASEIDGVEVIYAGDTPTYDFSVSTQKAQNVLGFKFEDTIHSIVADLNRNYDNCAKGVRV